MGTKSYSLDRGVEATRARKNLGFTADTNHFGSYCTMVFTSFGQNFGLNTEYNPFDEDSAWHPSLAFTSERAQI